jgi:hypothetical protein
MKGVGLSTPTREGSRAPRVAPRQPPRHGSLLVWSLQLMPAAEVVDSVVAEPPGSALQRIMGSS